MAFVAAGLVGPAGAVVGIDQSPDAVTKATARAAERRLSNVRFVPGDIHDPAPDGPFDAISSIEQLSGPEFTLRYNSRIDRARSRLTLTRPDHSQVVLSMQLPFAVIPLIHFTSDRNRMGAFANRAWVKALAWACAAVTVGLNFVLAVQAISGWMDSAGRWRPVIWLVVTSCGSSSAFLMRWSSRSSGPS